MAKRITTEEYNEKISDVMVELFTSETFDIIHAITEDDDKLLVVERWNEFDERENDKSDIYYELTDKEAFVITVTILEDDSDDGEIILDTLTEFLNELE
jgi:hypothetical protein